MLGQVTVTYAGPSTTIYCPDCILQAVQPSTTLDPNSLDPTFRAALTQLPEEV